MIRGTLIVDGFASELETDDVAVRDGVIGAVCERGLIGTQEDDGAGLVFAPVLSTFTHYDAQLMWTASSSLL